VTSGTSFPSGLYLQDGRQYTIWAPSVPNATTPSVACTVETGAGLSVTWNYDPNNDAGYYIAHLANRTKWTFRQVDPTSQV